MTLTDRLDLETEIHETESLANTAIATELPHTIARRVTFADELVNHTDHADHADVDTDIDVDIDVDVDIDAVVVVDVDIDVDVDVDVVVDIVTHTDTP